MMGEGAGMDKFRAVQEAHKVNLLLRAYMTHGHLVANLDPLKLREVYSNELDTLAFKYKIPMPYLSQLLDYKTYGFTEEDLDREFYIDAPELGGILGKKKTWILKDLIQAYKNAYC